jgi:yeast amino acid transporter
MYKFLEATLIVSGASIGSGIFYQSGIALYKGGPVSLMLAYLLMGSILYSVMVLLRLNLD